MISKELVGTSERLEQIKNKLSSSAACSVLHVSNLDRCLEEFDEITKKLQGRFLYFYSQNGNAQLFVLLVDFHRAMRLGCSSYIDAQFALLSSSAKQKIGTIGNDIYWICDMEVSGTDADPVFMKECITTIRDIYPEYHLIICNDKDHNMIRQEDAPYKHIFDEITVWHYTSKIDLKNIFYSTEEEPFVYLAIPEHADYRKIFAEDGIKPVRIAVEHYQANKLHPFVFEKVEFSQSYVSVLKITYEQLLNYQRYINIYNCKEHLEYFLWETENQKMTKMLVLYTIDDTAHVQDTIWNPSLEQMLQHRQGEWKLIADVVLMYPVVIEDISRLLHRKTAYDSDMNAYLNDLNIRLQCETGVPYGHDGEDMMARFKHRIDRYYLDAVQCRITKEMIMDILDKENVVIGSDLYTQIIVSVDKESNIGVLYVISLSCPFLLSHLLDNVVRNQLLVVDSENHIVGNLYEYMLNRWSIRLSGTPKSYVTIPMEKSAVNDQQLASLLMSETMYEEGEEFGQLIDKDIVKIVSEPYGMAQYDIAYVGVNLNTFIQFFPSYRGSKQYRLF